MRSMQLRMGYWLMMGMLAIPRMLMAQEEWPTGHYPLPKEGNVVGAIQTVKATSDDTLIDIGLRHGIGYNAIRAANPDTRVWLPGEGTEVTVPTRFILPSAPREGVVINIAELRLYYYPEVQEGETPRVETYPIGIGRQDWQTPLGLTRITAKLEDPAWYPPQSIIQEHAEQGEELPRVVPPGPDNPLGKYALMLDIPGYLIHGTNRPQGVGMRVSHGCIRMLPGDIEDLIYRIPKGTQVRLVNEPVKFAWTDKEGLLVQAYPLSEGAEVDMASHIEEAMMAATAAVQGEDFLVDYARLKNALEAPNGMPVPLALADAPFEIPYHFYDQLELDAALYSQLDVTLPQEDS